MFSDLSSGGTNFSHKKKKGESSVPFLSIVFPLLTGFQSRVKPTSKYLNKTDYKKNEVTHNYNQDVVPTRNKGTTIDVSGFPNIPRPRRRTSTLC